jgi:hypothetical protein
MAKITKSAINIPILELHNFCMINEVELDVENQEIILFEVTKNGN